MSLSGSTVLVTGATGFIGTHLCRKLRSLHAHVHAVARTVPENDDSGICWQGADMSDLSTVQSLFSSVKPDVVFHLASQVAGSRDRSLVLPMFASNLASTVYVLTQAAETGCRRVVLAGSLEEPDDAQPEAVPCSPYAAAKWAASSYARMFHALYQTPVVIARTFMVYGPGQDESKVIPYVITRLLQGKAPRLSSGERLVDWIFVRDLVDGLIAAATTPAIEGRTVDLGSGELVKVRSVVEQIANIIGAGVSPALGVLPDRPREAVRVANREETSAALGWKATTSLRGGLEETVLWYQRQLQTCNAAASTAPWKLGKENRR